MAVVDPNAGNSWRTGFVVRQRKVIDHYREVLERPMPPTEREDILRRVAEIEREISQAVSVNPTSNQPIAA